MINKKPTWLFSAINTAMFFILVFNPYGIAYADNDTRLIPICFTNNNQVISDCETAIKYRDNKLVEDLDLTLKLYENEKDKEERIDKIIKKMNEKLNVVKSMWDASNEEHRKKMIVAITTATLSTATGLWAGKVVSKLDLSSIEKDVLNDMIKRLNNFSISSINAIIDRNIDVHHIAETIVILPVSTLFSVVPVLNISLSMAGTVLNWSDVVFEYWDQEIDHDYYKKSSDILEKGIKELSKKYVNNQIDRLNYIINQIDKNCATKKYNPAGFTDKNSNSDYNKKSNMEPSNCFSVPVSNAQTNLPVLSAPTNLRIENN